VNRSLTNNLEIQPDDVLTIRVSAPEQEAALPFNLTKSLGAQENISGVVELETYLVSNEGTIVFPVIGTIKVKGLTNIELAIKIQNLIDGYVKNPIVNVRILNFQVTVLGEVNGPGTFSIEDDHLSITKALSMAGDLTIFGKRTNILIIGEEDGVKTHAYLDLTNANVVNSPHYYLRQNDVVYVEPKGTRRQSASSLGIASSYISVASALIAIIFVLTR
jgi:polysaccharide export outer membrane protein